jgi:hypothetical protein
VRKFCHFEHSFLVLRQYFAIVLQFEQYFKNTLLINDKAFWEFWLLMMVPQKTDNVYILPIWKRLGSSKMARLTYEVHTSNNVKMGLMCPTMGVGGAAVGRKD